MKGIKIIDDILYCCFEEGIIKKDNTLIKVEGDIINGFTFEKSKITNDFIDEDDWIELDPFRIVSNEKYEITAGETSWGGVGFVAVKNKKSNLVEWVFHSSVMNNPLHISLENNAILLKTDLNFPNGVDFVIPIQKPEEFIIKTDT